MASKLVVFVLLLCVIEISLAAVAIERAPVTDPKLKQQGYSCYTSKYGPMKKGQVNNNYSSDVCGKISCGDGIIQYESCSPYSVEGRPMNPQDPTKPFPECCNYPF